MSNSLDPDQAQRSGDKEVHVKIGDFAKAHSICTKAHFCAVFYLFIYDFFLFFIFLRPAAIYLFKATSFYKDIFFLIFSASFDFFRKNLSGFS